MPIEASSRRVPRWSASRGSVTGEWLAALALWVLLPSASGAQANGFDSRRYESHPTGPSHGPARAQGLGRRHAYGPRRPAPGPAPPKLSRDDPLDALSRPKAAPDRADTPPANATTEPSTGPAPVTHHQDELSSRAGAVPQEQVQAGSPEGGEEVRRSRW